MEPANILIIITTIGIIILLAVLVPALIQIKKTTEKTEFFIEQLSAGFDPLLTNIKTTSTELQELSETLREKIEKTDRILDSAQEASGTLLKLSGQIQEAANPIIARIGGITAGINAFSTIFKITHKKERRYFDE